jgi:hypothetical protein
MGGEVHVRIHVGEPELVPKLLEFFEGQADCIVAQVGEAEIEVSLLGSFGAEMHDDEIERLVEAFRAEGGLSAELLRRARGPRSEQ